jgi:hypothetical protein
MFDHRYKLWKASTKEADPLVDALLEGKVERSLVDLIEIIYKDKIQRSFLEAALLASNDEDVIAELLELPVDGVRLYRDVYFDVAEVTKLQKLSHIERVKDGYEKGMKMWALAQGLQFIEWRFGNAVNISPVSGLTSLFSDCYYKSKEAYFNPNSAEASKEGIKWAKQATDIARLLKLWVTDGEEAMKDIEIALQKFTGDDIQFPSIEDLNNESDN